jgi:transposase InsO family protein
VAQQGNGTKRGEPLTTIDSSIESTVVVANKSSIPQANLTGSVPRFFQGIGKHPVVKPRIISDNGSQFIANDFKSFVREYGLTHFRTSPYYPQNHGKLERWHGSLKSECIRPSSPATKEEADCLAGLSEALGKERDRKPEAARKLPQRKPIALKQVA